jgi:predicted nucleic acid-binding protein
VTICVDASVAIKWLFPEEYSAEALALVTDAASAKERIVAPTLLNLEVTNVIRQRMRRGTLTLDEAQAELDRFFSFPVETVLPRRLHRRALMVADRYDIPSAYDAHYVALAELTGAVLWTNDERLLRRLAGRVAFARRIAEYEAQEE